MLSTQLMKCVILHLAASISNIIIKIKMRCGRECFKTAEESGAIRRRPTMVGENKTKEFYFKLNQKVSQKAKKKQYKIWHVSFLFILILILISKL